MAGLGDVGLLSEPNRLIRGQERGAVILCQGQQCDDHEFVGGSKSAERCWGEEYPWGWGGGDVCGCRTHGSAFTLKVRSHEGL